MANQMMIEMSTNEDCDAVTKLQIVSDLRDRSIQFGDDDDEEEEQKKDRKGEEKEKRKEKEKNENAKDHK